MPARSLNDTLVWTTGVGDLETPVGVYMKLAAGRPNSFLLESIEGALAALEQVLEAAEAEGASVTPRAIYVVEQSNPRRGSREEARPVFIWKHLRARGIPANEIAIFTDTIAAVYRSLPAARRRSA